jgi:dihydrofolate synthase / folylpolyglutamate synthase
METLHPNSIDLGLKRVAKVWSRLQAEPVPFPVITIAGTNGKGSCAAMLESIYLAAGYRTACYTSPHLQRYNERVRLNGIELEDVDLCAAFARVDGARRETTLTYFEVGTLAALDLFVRAEPDLAILEVGLGGRLDAVNILDPDVAVVTTIDLDHTAWLGGTLDEIAAEKAGIFRPRRPAVVGHRSPSSALVQRAEALDCDLFVLGRDFDAEGDGACWRWIGPAGESWVELPSPAMTGTFQRDNAATALMAVSCLARRLPVEADDLRFGLQRARVNGRFQIVPGEPTWILDVAHNAQAARALAANLRSFHCTGRIHAVLGTFKDKDPGTIAEPLAGLIDCWYLGQARDSRALPVAQLRAAVEGVAVDSRLRAYSDIDQALTAAAEQARPGDCILAFGSFTTVEVALMHAHRNAPA